MTLKVTDIETEVHVQKFVKMRDVRQGDVLVADDGWTCLKEGELVVACVDEVDGRLYVLCGGPDDGGKREPKDQPYRDERHYLDGQSSKESANAEVRKGPERVVGLHAIGPEGTRARLAETQALLRNMLDCYWGKGDGARPPDFIAEAARLSGWELPPFDVEKSAHVAHHEDCPSRKRQKCRCAELGGYR